MNKKLYKSIFSVISIIIFILLIKINLEGKEVKVTTSYGQSQSNLIIKPLKNDIKIIRPFENKFSTREEAITFLGMADPNKELKLNNKKINVHTTGNFVVEVPLNIGVNNLKFILGDKTLNYEIIREFKIIDSILPAKSLFIEGGMKANVIVRLYSGSTAYAELNGKRIDLEEVEANKYLSARGTKYANFIGSINTGKVKNRTSLGNIVIHSTFNGVEETEEGAEVVLNKPQHKRTLGVINKDSAFVYDSTNISVIPLNEVYPLAKGTEDYITSKIIVDDKEYYILASNKRVKAEDIDIVQMKKFSDNRISNITIYEEDNNVMLKLNCNSKVPYTFLTDGICFKDVKNQDYSLEEYNISMIKIYFDYVTSINNKINFQSNFLFNDASIQNDNGKKYLELNINDPKKYNGHFTYYDDDGNLIFKFKDKKRSLQNMKIVIDPGHGLIENNTLDPGALGFNGINENVLNTEIAKLIEDRLKEKGAEVVRLQTENNVYPLKIRGSKARENNADLYISIHNNSGGSGKCNATECYYFTPYSKDFAKNINESLTKCYNNVLYKGTTGEYNRGFKYNYYTVTLERENPSVLVEVGYIDHPEFFNKITDKEIRIKLANSIVDGIEKSLN